MSASLQLSVIPINSIILTLIVLSVPLFFLFVFLSSWRAKRRKQQK